MAATMDSSTASIMPCNTPSTITASTALVTSSSSRPSRHSATMGRGSSAWVSAEITTAANTGCGSSANQRLANSISKTMAPAATKPDALLLAPASSFAELPEKPAPTGMPCTAPDTKLAKPKPASSRFASIESPLRSANARTEPQDSA